MKKTCNLCKALRLKQGYGYSCELKYEIDNIKGIPFEQCPKPLTYTEYFKEFNKIYQ